MQESTSIITIVGALSMGVLGLAVWLVKYIATTLSEKIHDNAVATRDAGDRLTNATREIGERLTKASEHQRREHREQSELLAKVLIQTHK